MKTSDTKPSSLTPAPCVIELREMLQSVLGENFVRLYHYGSRVEGGATDDSDFDVLCVTRHPLSPRQRDSLLDRRMDIQLERDVLFDLHFYTEEEIRSPPLSFTPYMQHVTAEGMVV
ncbi:MAG: nucleotidyltransferase domain-containing protein [Pirellulales bacterium]|nr:nucleotidyltransferase domain-containing protein [Pirellulales bacterium]